MRRLSMVLVLSSVLLVAAVPRADVAPFPSWQVALNGHAATANANGVIYYGGDFTKVGRALAPFSARLDPLSLSMTPLSGCARRGGTLVDGPYVDFPGGLTDGDGPFNVPAGTKLVRIGPDCRFDRRFRVELPAGVSIADAHASTRNTPQDSAAFTRVGDCSTASTASAPASASPKAKLPCRLAHSGMTAISQ